MSAANEPLQKENSGVATIQSVSVAPDGSQVEIRSNRPFTYTSYKTEAPPKVIVDLSQTEPGSQNRALEVNAGNVKRIDMVREMVGSGVLTRMEVSLGADAEFEVGTDPKDKTTLLVKLGKPVAAPQAAAVTEQRPQTETEAKEAPLSEVKVEEKSIAPEPQQGAAPPASVEVAAPAATVAPVASAAEKAEAVPAKTENAHVQAPAAEAKVDAKEVVPAEAPNPPVAAQAPVARDTNSAAGGAAPAKAAQAGEKALTSIVASAEGIDLGLTGGVETFNAFKLSKPDRLVVDLFGVKNRTGMSNVPLGAQGIGNARIGVTPDKVRVVLDAVQGSLPPFEVRPTEGGLRIRFKTSASAATAGASARSLAVAAAPAPSAPAVEAAVPEKAPAPVTAPAPPAAVAVAAAPAAPAATPAVSSAVKAQAEVPATAVRKGKGALEAIDFKVADNTNVRIIMKLAGDCQPEKPVRAAKGISLTIKNCQVPKKLQRTLDASAFGSSVVDVVPYQVKSKGSYVAKVQVHLKDSSPFTMFREGDTLVLEVEQTKPVQPAKAPAAPKMAAQPVEEIAAAPALPESVVELSRPGAAKKQYKGRRVTLEFSDADVRKIFQLIAEVSNLNFLVADDVSGTISIKLVNVPWDQALDVILDAKGLGMQRDGNIVQIKPKGKILSQADEETAAKKASERAMEMRTAVFDVNYAAVGDVVSQFAALKSDRGIISKDERTSKIIVKDIPPALDEMRQLLKTIDTPEKQVMIEARIVEASSNFTRDLGVQWDFHFKDASASVANINAMDTTFGGIVSTGLPSTTTGGLANAISFGKLTSNVQIDMRLSAAATVGDVKIISSPKVVTLNNKAAKISQGQSIPYQTTSAEGTKTEFVEAALTLEVTPHITPDGSVSMKIRASNNSPGTGTPPPINKKEATTELVVANGETTVIGGIYVDSDTESNTGVPFLSDIPLLGWLFKSNSKSKNKSELLIFITPKLVNM